MQTNAPLLTDKELESSIANMLRFGVTVSAILVFFGGVLYLLRESQTLPDYRHFAGKGISLNSIPGVLSGAMHLDANSVILLGLLLLIATPIVRVAFCIVGFARQRDLLYVAISIAVFVILIYSLVRAGL